MSDETPDTEDTEATAEPVKVKQVAIAAGLVSAALAAAVAFTVAGPVGVGLAAAGVAGTGYTVHRIRNPKTGRQHGVLHSWLTRTRKPSKAGTLTWPFTGSQQKRALTRSTSGRAGAQSSRSKLPHLTSTRAKRSQALTGTGSSSKRSSTGRRPVPTTAARRSSTTGSLRGLRPGAKPLTPTRTPAKLSNSRAGSLSRSKPGTPARKSTSSTNSPSRRTGSGGTSGRSSKPLRLTNSRSRHRPTTATPTRRGPLSLGPKSTRGGGKRAGLSSGKGTTRGTSSTTARRRPTGIGRLNPWRSTRGGRSLGGRSTGSRRTRRAERLGGTLGSSSPKRRGPLGRLQHRVTPDRNRDRTPNRTRLRPQPYRRRTTGQLLRTSLRVPVRQRSKPGSRRVVAPFRRPNLTQAKRARRTLRLRSGVWLRSGASWFVKTPARRWDRLMDKLPKAPLPITHYTERAGMKPESGPKHKTPNPTPTPDPTPLASVTPIVKSLIPINQNGNVIYVSSPNDLIRDAFQQMAQFHPSSASEVEAWISDLGETLNDVGQSFGVLADQMRDGMPFAAPFSDSVREVGVAIAASSGLAQSAHATMRSAHADDFKRFEDPRPDEGMWNPEANR